LTHTLTPSHPFTRKECKDFQQYFVVLLADQTDDSRLRTAMYKRNPNEVDAATALDHLKQMKQTLCIFSEAAREGWRETYEGRTRTLKHVTQPSSLMNSDISTWRHVIVVDNKPENQQLAKQMQCCLPRLPQDHAPTKRRESKGSLQPSKPCWGRAAPAQHVKHGRQSITWA